MNDIEQKHLTRMLEGTKVGLAQLDEAITMAEDQLSSMQDQRKEMQEAVEELSALLGVTEEEPTLNTEEA